MNTDDERTLGRLIAMADSAPRPNDIAAARARQAVKARWQRSLRARRNRRFGYAAAAAIGVMAVSLSLLLPSGEPPLPIATLMHSSGSVALYPDVSGIPVTMNESNIALRIGERIETRNDGFVTLNLGGTHEVRLAPTTSITLKDAGSLQLTMGRIYAATLGAEDAALSISTPHGLVEDIGTQFLVAVDGTLSVSVREGQVRVDRDTVVSAGESARVSAADITVEDNASPDQWLWITAASTFDLEGRTLDEFLTWICGEQKWMLTYGDSDLEARSRSVTLSGSISGLNAIEALDAVLPSVALSWRLEEGALIVSSRP